MAAEQTNRTRVYVWPSGSDPFTRDQMNTSHEALEDRVATFLSGPIADRPASTNGTFSTERMFYLATDQNTPYGVLYYCDYVDGNDGALTWVAVNNFGSPAALAPGASSVDGTSPNSARADHVHAMLPWGGTGDLSPVGPSTGSAGSLDKYARADHTHPLGTLAAGSVGSSALAPGSVGTSALADGSVTRLKLAESERTPVGTVVAFAGQSAPTGWLLCDGSAVSRSTYANLFAVVGVRFNGNNADASTFRVPDLRAQVPMGATTSGDVGSTVGNASVTITAAQVPGHTHSINHNHVETSTIGNHSHDQPAIFGYGAGQTSFPTGILAYTQSQGFFTNPSGSHKHTIGNYTGTSGLNQPGAATPLDVRQPSLILNYLIKT
jgi:microcystin-dependent protein